MELAQIHPLAYCLYVLQEVMFEGCSLGFAPTLVPPDPSLQMCTVLSQQRVECTQLANWLGDTLEQIHMT